MNILQKLAEQFAKTNYLLNRWMLRTKTSRKRSFTLHFTMYNTKFNYEFSP